LQKIGIWPNNIYSPKVILILWIERNKPKIMNGPSYFEIQAGNVSRAVKFYEDVFGWEFTEEEYLPIAYWRILADGQRGGLLKRPVPAKPGGANAFVCSMEVANFGETAKKILSNGGQVTMYKFAVPGVCWQGYFLDAEGNTFGLFQSDPNAK
jgi:predicted enzyme related to lactoylglutathione lyase